MTGREELAALLFEMQRARGPIDKARAAARAWRTLRELSPTERRMIAREIGSSGAEDFLESLGGGGRGFSPSAVLEALTRVEGDDGASLDDVVADLRDPERRVETIGELLDAAAETAFADPGAPSERSANADLELDGAPDAEPDTEPETSLPPVPAVEPAPDRVPGPDESGSPPVEPEVTDGVGEIGPVAAPSPAPPTPPLPQPRPPEPRAPSVWDELLRRDETTRDAAPPTDVMSPSATACGPVRGGGRPLSALVRLRRLRERPDELRSASVADIRHALDAFPEAWARRRALCFLLSEGIPGDAGDALTLVSDLERTTDRRWCLNVLAERGDLVGSHLERALELLDSPAARRRLERTAKTPTSRA